MKDKPRTKTTPVELRGQPWASASVLREARTRMRKLVNDSNVHIQEMLRDLLVESGWEQEDFLTALVQDIHEHGKERWDVPSPSLVSAAPAALEGERRPLAKAQPPPPPVTKSGTMARVRPSQFPGAKSEAG